MDIIMCLAVDKNIKRERDLIVIALSQSATHSLAFSFLLFFFLIWVYMLCPVDRATVGTHLNKCYSQVILTSTYNDTEGNDFF